MAHYPIREVTINVVFKSFILVRSLAARGGCFKCEMKMTLTVEYVFSPRLLLFKYS